MAIVMGLGSTSIDNSTIERYENFIGFSLGIYILYLIIMIIFIIIYFIKYLKIKNIEDIKKLVL
jgi:hypothetical protein